MHKKIFPIFLAIVLLAAAYTFAPCPPLPDGAKAERIVVEKRKHRLHLIGPDGATLRSYRVSFGAHPEEGHKQRQGDERTPEGQYAIDFRNPGSAFFKSLHISYPSVEDRTRARKAGVPPGGDIMIHGLPNKMPWIGRWHRWWNWTDGCIAVTNQEMRQIWEAVGTRNIPIEIRP